MRLRGLKRFFRSGAPSPEKETTTMATSRELPGKHDASAEVSEIPSPESELATPQDEHIFELPHERALRGKESDTVILPERTIVPSTASTAENPQEQERGRNPTRAKVFTSANEEHNIVSSTNAVTEKSPKQASHPQQPKLDSTIIPRPEPTLNDIVPPTASMAEIPHERGRSPPRPEVDSKPGYIVPSTNTLPALSRQHASRPQQTKSSSLAVPESLDTPAERNVRTNLPNISTNKSCDQEFVAVFDDSSDESDKPVEKPTATPVERKDSAMDHPATDTSGVPPLKIHDKLKRLVPYATPLSIRDLERCWALEQDCFGGRDYCTKEQLAYRLTHCSSYSIGIFISTTSLSSPVATFAAARSPDSSQPERKALLIGHIIATKTNSDRISLADLQVGGHRNDGINLAINNLAVLFQYRRLGAFSLLIKEFVIRMHQAAVAEKLLLLSREVYIPLFQHMRFEDRGQSSVAIGDENWYDMALDFKEFGPPSSPSKYEPAEEEDDSEGGVLRSTSGH